MARCVRSCLPGLLVTVATGAYALPPDTAPSYVATYTRTIVRKDLTPPKTITDPIRITIAGKQARWENRHGGQVTLYDYTKSPGTMTIIDPQLGGKLALVTALEGPMSNWDSGYATLAADGPPPVAGETKTIAGKTCTVLRFTTKRFGNPELCVTSEGVVARFHLDDPEARSITTFEATEITVGTQDARAFRVPDGWAVQDMTAIPRLE